MYVYVSDQCSVVQSLANARARARFLLYVYYTTINYQCNIPNTSNGVS